MSVTKELVFTGDKINARRALELGLINRVTSPDELMPLTLVMADKIRRRSRFAMARAKEVIDASIDRALPDAYAMETEAFVACFETGDQREGMQAFLEKREAAVQDTLKDSMYPQGSSDCGLNHRRRLGR